MSQMANNRNLIRKLNKKGGYRVDFCSIRDAKLSVKTSNKLFGFFVDIGAPKSVLGTKELNRIFARMGAQKTTLKTPMNRFRFADASFEFVVAKKVPLAVTYDHKPICVQTDLLMANLRAPLGMGTV